MAIAGVLILTVAGLARFWSLSSLPPLRGRESVAVLRDSVVVLWDSLAVPHILATHDADAFATLGYLHARDRLWQLDLLRHAALGRLSELFGPRTVAADQDLRELEIARIAADRIARMAPESRAVLDAYAGGVNAWIERGTRPLELRFLGHAPEPWEPLHSIAIGVLQAWDLRTTGDEIELAEAAARLGVERALELAASPPQAVHRDAWWPRGAALRPDRGRGLAAARAEPRSAASNAWAISGRRTRSGKPILANDPHLTLRVPSVWYLTGMHAPSYEVVGATIPGIPTVVLGHTRAVAWGFTNAMVDDLDYVAEQLSPDSTTYRTPRGWLPVDVIAETLGVRGEPDVLYTRRRTARGPLIANVPLGGNRQYAQRWVAQDGGSDEVSALLDMARASTLAEFTQALGDFRSPQQSVIYADSSGHIGYFLAGRVPHRVRGTSPFPSDGTALSGDPWTGWVDDRELPRTLDPAEGWIATANNPMVAEDYPHFLSRHYDLPYRARRIEQLLAEDSIASFASVSRHQLDIVDLFARDMRGLMAAAAVAIGRADLSDKLRGWDGAMRPDAGEAALFWRWYQELARLVYDEVGGYRPAAPLHRWLAQRRSSWFDLRTTPERETLQQLTERALERALAARAAVPWREVHSTIMDHPLGRVPLLGWLLGLDIGPLYPGGSNYTVNNSTIFDAEPPYISSYGPSLRHVVDLNDVDSAGGFILPTGQSGHPGSPHYRDQTERWLRGELWSLPLDPTQVSASDTLVLIP